jgi:hypothetical protein
MSQEIRTPSRLEYGLWVSDVAPGWHLDAEPDVMAAYEQVEAVKKQAGLDYLIDGLKIATPSTYIHVSRLGRAATQWSVENDLSPEQILEVVLSVEAHDIGKVVMPQLIEYEGIFNDQQRQQVSGHPVIGAALFSSYSREMPEQALRRQVIAQILCHHMHHGDPLIQGLASQFEDKTAVNVGELHTFVRTADVIDATANLAARPYVQERFVLERAKRMMPDDEGRFVFSLGHLVDEVSDMIDMDPRREVFGRTLGQLIEELAIVLPPTMPRNTKFDVKQGGFVTV